MLDTLLFTGQIPEMRWEHGDDRCDCMFQRIGWWTNPYLGRTLFVRLCCAWKNLIELHPELNEFIHEVPAFDDPNTFYWYGPRDWDSEDEDMPRALWYRQLAVRERCHISEIRKKYEHLNPPKAVRK